MITRSDWVPIPLPAMLALDREFERWNGTRFMEGAQVPGMGVDCIRFAGAVWDKCRGKAGYTEIRNHRRGSDRHDQHAVFETSYNLMLALSPVLTVRDGKIEPGDMVVTDPGPHVYLAGTRPGTVWVATTQGVRCYGVLAISQKKIIRIYRPTDKGTWQ